MKFRTLAASALALSALSLFGQLGAGPARAQQSEAVSAASRHDGVLQVLWADPKDHSESEGDILFTLNHADGRRIGLDVAPGLQAQAIANAGKQVTVTGSPAASAVAGQERIAAVAIEASAVEPQADVERQAAVTGTKKVLYILLKFKGDAQEPFKPAHFLNITNPMTGSGKIPATINGFYDAASYGKFKWTGVVAGNKWYTLSKTHAEVCGGDEWRAKYCPNLEKAGDEALKMIEKDVDVTKFNTINYVFNNDLNWCAYGGPGFVYKGKTFGVTWQPPWGQQAGIYAHELGHSLGLPHSGWRYGTYDSNHDAMSRGAVAKLVTCGTYKSVNNKKKMNIGCDEPGAGYIMAHQNHLGWVPAASKAIHKTKGAKVYDIEANANPLGKTIKMVQVCIAGSPCTSASAGGRFITVEVKTKGAKFDRGVPSEGVIIHDVAMARGPIAGKCYSNPQTGWAMPFDATPGDWDPNTCTGLGLSNMAYKPGQTLVVDQFGVKVEVLSRAKNVYKVRVTKLK